MSPGWANTTTVMEMHAKPSGKFFLSIPCVPSMNIIRVFIGGVSPSKCNYYSTSLQWSYSHNISGHTRNFPITVVSGLQLRWAPLLQTAFFATITLAAVSEDIPSFAGQHKRLAGAASRRLRSNDRKATISFAHRSLQRTCRLVFACLRLPGRGSNEDHHILGFESHVSSCTFGNQTEGGVPNKWFVCSTQIQNKCAYCNNYCQQYCHLV